MELDFVSLISTIGFPIVMVLWYMFRTDKRIEENTKVLNELVNLIEKVLEKL